MVIVSDYILNIHMILTFTSYCDFGKQLLFETIKILASFQKCITMYMYFEGENGITIQYVQIYYPGSLTLDNSIN